MGLSLELKCKGVFSLSLETTDILFCHPRGGRIYFHSWQRFPSAREWQKMVDYLLNTLYLSPSREIRIVLTEFIKLTSCIGALPNLCRHRYKGFSEENGIAGAGATEVEVRLYWILPVFWCGSWLIIKWKQGMVFVNTSRKKLNIVSGLSFILFLNWFHQVLEVHQKRTNY